MSKMTKKGAARGQHLVGGVLAGMLTMSTLITAPAMAGEGSFGWIYTLDLQPKGTLEFEQRLQLTRKQAAGTYDLWRSRTELEYGLTDDIQIAGYLNAYSVNAAGNYTNPLACGAAASCTGGYAVPEDAGASYRKTDIDGASVEAIWRLSNPVVSPVGVGLYAELTRGKLADEVETRLLLQSNFLDDSLIVAANIVYEAENIKFTGETSKESMIDVLLGVSYRFAPRWTAGIEHRHHNDYAGHGLNQHTQRADFIGPNLHYATKDWWATAAYRRQIGGTCWEPGAAECSGGKVWDSHGRDEFIVKFGRPF